MAHAGKPYDAFQGAARGKAATTFCRRRKVPMSARYDIELYGNSSAAPLARCWCHKMAHFYEFERISEQGDAHICSAADHEAYVEPPQLQRMYDEGAGHPTIRNRIAQIRDLFR